MTTKIQKRENNQTIYIITETVGDSTEVADEIEVFSMAKLLKDWDEKYLSRDVDWGNPVGNELW